jgi:hypothetical protein
MMRYTDGTVAVSAEQFLRYNCEDIRDWVAEKLLKKNLTGVELNFDKNERPMLLIPSSGIPIVAMIGDWVVCHGTSFTAIDDYTFREKYKPEANDRDFDYVMRFPEHGEISTKANELASLIRNVKPPRDMLALYLMGLFNAIEENFNLNVNGVEKK